MQCKLTKKKKKMKVDKCPLIREMGNKPSGSHPVYRHLFMQHESSVIRILDELLIL